MKRGQRAVLLAMERQSPSVGADGLAGPWTSRAPCPTAVAEFPGEGGQGGGKLCIPNFDPGQSSSDLSLFLCASFQLNKRWCI